MKILRPIPMPVVVALLALAGGIPAHGADAAPIYSNDFEAAEAGKVPEDFLVTAGAFGVVEDGGKKVLELPGSPLDTFGLLFGPVQKGEVSASAKFFGTKKGRKVPAFGISLGGIGGFRLQVSAAKQTLEFFQGDEPRHSVAYAWQADAWTALRIQLRKTAEGWVVQGKAWAAGAPEPEKWMIEHALKEEPAGGRAGIWGSPYSGTPIRFDDLLLAPAH
jgi:hypothetical protein